MTVTTGVADREPPTPPARILFRQPVTEEGLLDAGWWPRSCDLEAELPALLDALWLAGREVTRVSYALDFWNSAPRQLRVAGKVIRLGGFHTQIPGLLTLLDTWGRERINLMVIPPDTVPEVADRALEIAAGEPNSDQPDQVLQHARDQVAAGLRDLDSSAMPRAWEDDSQPA